jgi:hypothetical protein
MWIEVILSNDDARALVERLLPVTIELGRGEIWVHDPLDVTLVPDVGMRVVCKARVRWTIAGFGVPIVMHTVAATLEPKIVSRDHGMALVFALAIEHADVAGIPTLVDNEITRAINRELEAKRIELSWAYESTLDHRFALPAVLRELGAIDVEVADARVKVTRDAVGLALLFKIDVARRDGVTNSRRTAAPPPRTTTPTVFAR